MFKSAVVKLTLLYVAIIAVICLYFSLNLYDISTKELERGLRAQQKRLNIARPRQITDEDDEVENELEEVLSLGDARIVSRLLVANAVILVIGGFGSYLLAKKTLDPIEKAHEAQKRFTADASHELRTPLATLQTEIEVALRNKNLSQQQSKEILISNLEELDDLSQLTDSLLNLARDDQNLRLLPVNLMETISIAKKRIQKQYHDVDIELRNLDSKNITVMGEQDNLVSLFVILFGNAIKYSGAQAEINCEVKKQRNHIDIYVSDDGPGIKSSDLPHIFERFYQGDTSRTKTQSSGHGLGLSIAKQIVDLHHGSVSAKSEIGVGTTFQIKLPSK